jgi:galactose mutarotase-like enzyme
MPFLCIEPWYGMAAYDGEHADLEEKCDMFRLLPGERRDLTYSIQFH